jgi:hypothetical protein
VIRRMTKPTGRRESTTMLVILLMLAGFGLFGGRAAAGGNGPGDKDSKPSVAAKPAATKQQIEDDERLEGEKRFHNNCGRCHMAPQKFPPRVMAMVVRHMRVRATVTDEDMRLILNYMTQ